MGRPRKELTDAGMLDKLREHFRTKGTNRRGKVWRNAKPRNAPK